MNRPRTWSPMSAITTNFGEERADPRYVEAWAVSHGVLSVAGLEVDAALRLTTKCNG